MTFAILDILAGFLILTSMLVVISRSPKNAVIFYAIQSLVLISCFVSLGILTDSKELFTWSITAFFTKTLLVPGAMLFALKKIGPAASAIPDERPNMAAFVAAAAIELVICFVIVEGIQLPQAADVKPALAVSLAHFFIGLTCIVSQRNIVRQVFGYCLMENGSHLTLALLAPEAPALVEIGVATDSLFAVIIMLVVVMKIYKHTGSVDAHDLNGLRG